MTQRSPHHHHHHHHTAGSERRFSNRRRLTGTLVLVVVYMAAEVVGGLVSGSLALLADAGHMLSDAGSIGLALFAMWLATRPSGSRHTYGYYRTEILAALVNGAALVAISILIFVEAWQRLRSPPTLSSLKRVEFSDTPEFCWTLQNLYTLSIWVFSNANKSRKHLK